MLKTQRIFAASLFVIILRIAGGPAASGGELIVYNTGAQPAKCLVDGYSKATGAASDVAFNIAPGEKLNVPVNLASKSGQLDSMDCGGKLQTRAMNITSDGPNGVVFLNGQQTRTLNVILYSAIPTDPTLGYEPLVRGLILRYQAKHPDVLLNMVLNPTGINTYDFDNLETNVLGPRGFDVAELDTVFLGYLVKKGLIAPMRITGEDPWPVAKQAVTVDGALYGVPSWLCSDFLFEFDADLSSVQTFDQMKKLWGGAPAGHGSLVGDLDGSWTIPALYIQAFIQVHGSAALSDALKMPPDGEVIRRVAQLGSACTLVSGNPCIDGTYHSSKDGTVEEAFATEHAQSGTGFSERSFFIAFFEQAQRNLSLTPVPWGDQPHARHAVYTDAFVTNKKTCAMAPCGSDSEEFAAFMTNGDTKKYIALSGDLPAGSPPRHLLVATKPFYSIDEVKADPVYKQVFSNLLSGDMVAYPNDFSPELKYQLLSGICPSLKRESSKWVCNVPKPPKP